MSDNNENFSAKTNNILLSDIDKKAYNINMLGKFARIYYNDVTSEINRKFQGNDQKNTKTPLNIKKDYVIPYIEEIIEEKQSGSMEIDNIDGTLKNNIKNLNDDSNIKLDNDNSLFDNFNIQKVASLTQIFVNNDNVSEINVHKNIANLTYIKEKHEPSMDDIPKQTKKEILDYQREKSVNHEALNNQNYLKKYVGDCQENEDINFNRDEYLILKIDNFDTKIKNTSENNEIDENICRYFTRDEIVDTFDNPEGISYKFSGPVYSSLCSKKGKNKWRKTSLRAAGEYGFQSQIAPNELTRSQYSLVSAGELTSDAVQLWLGLPEEVKYDPALAPFRQYYEQQYGNIPNSPVKIKSSASGGHKSRRLPSVKSAPQIQNDEKSQFEVKSPSKSDATNVDTPSSSIPYIDEDGSNSKEFEDLQLHSYGGEKFINKIPTPQTKCSLGGYYAKITVLILCWVFCSVVFITCGEKVEDMLQSSVAPGEVKSFKVPLPNSSTSMGVKLLGPFLSDQDENGLNPADLERLAKMFVWIENPDAQSSEVFSIALLNTKDFLKGKQRNTILYLPPTNSMVMDGFEIRVKTTTNETVPFSMSYRVDPMSTTAGLIYSGVLLFSLYFLIITEVINRTMAAVIISTAGLAALAIAGERPTLPEIISWLDGETLILLFSMMLLVAIMAETGLFDYLAVFTFEVTKGRLWPLINLLCFITAIISTVLDNVTTVLLMTPVVIRLCEVMNLDPIPILLSMVLYSNIGGTATAVGDPPNVIIASNKDVVAAGVNFANFTVHMFIGICFVTIQTYLQLRYTYRDTNKLRLSVPREIQEIRRQISTWRRAQDSIPHLSQDENVVRHRLSKKIWKLNCQLEHLIKESSKRACPKECFESMLTELKAKYKIRDKPLLIKTLIAISFVISIFFLHSIPEMNKISLGWTALLGALLLLILSDREDLEPVLHRVEWSTLLFFAALFVLMEVLAKFGLISFIGDITESLIMMVHERARLAVAIVLLVWVTGVFSAFVDNIPLTTMMIRVVTSLGTNKNLNLPMTPMIWALSFSSCLGGNGTLIGASANVVTAGVAEQHGYKITFKQFFVVGFPIMIGHLVVATIYLLICHCVFEWH